MVAGMENYSQLLRRFEQLSQRYIVDEILEALKEEYKKEISSKRVLETIINIGSLLQVLEKRGILQYDDIRVLKDIATKYVRDESVQKILLDYEEWLEENSSNINNLYTYAIVPRAEMPINISNSNIGISVQPIYTTNQTQNEVATPVSYISKEKELQSLIITKIGKKIGRFWRDVSRRLDIGESDIEEIEKIYPHELQSYDKKFKKAMELYFMENHENWKLELMAALESSRRGDLKNIVEEIILKQNSS